MQHTKLSIYLSYLLRHNPAELDLTMDKRGWVDVKELIGAINKRGKYKISRELLDELVKTDRKGRYRFSEDGKRIKACQGHSLEWIEPELTWCDPPAVLYHGTTSQAHKEIRASGAIQRMKRHAVHMQAEKEPAWKSAKRWKQTPVILVIDAARMAKDGYRFGVSDNGVWCTQQVPVDYIINVLHQL